MRIARYETRVKEVPLTVPLSFAMLRRKRRRAFARKVETMTAVYILIVALFVVAGAIYAVKFIKRPRVDDRKQLDLALFGLNKAIQKNPNDAVAFTKRGAVRFKKGDVKGALADLDKAIQLEPTSTEAHYHRGCVLQAGGEHSQAEKEFNWIMAHSEDPFYKTAISNRLAAVQKAGRR